MRTVNLKNAAGGRMVVEHPGATPGPQNLIYQINNVPDDIAEEAVAQQANMICFAHPHNDPSAYVYDWSELAGKRQGAIINRYKAKT